MGKTKEELENELGKEESDRAKREAAFEALKNKVKEEIVI